MWARQRKWSWQVICLLFGWVGLGAQNPIRIHLWGMWHCMWHLLIQIDVLIWKWMSGSFTSSSTHRTCNASIDWPNRYPFTYIAPDEYPARSCPLHTSLLADRIDLGLPFLHKVSPTLTTDPYSPWSLKLQDLPSVLNLIWFHLNSRTTPLDHTSFPCLPFALIQAWMSGIQINLLPLLKKESISGSERDGRHMESELLMKDVILNSRTISSIQT